MILGLLVLAFLLGSIPFGYIVAKSKGVDIFSVGSGNIGATNVVRALGPALGIFVFVLDVAKGFLPGMLARSFIQGNPLGIDHQVWIFVVGVMAMIGHMFSPWIKFKGGKGVATGLGAVLAAMPLTALGAVVVMILVTTVTRYVSLGSMLSGLSTIPFSIFMSHDSPQLMPLILLLNGFLIYKHRSNIERLRNGTENKFRFKKSEPTVSQDESKQKSEDNELQEQDDQNS